MPKVAPPNDNTAPSPGPPSQKDLVIDLSGDGCEKTSSTAPSDASTLTSSPPHSNSDTRLPRGWKKYPTKKKDLKKNPKLPREFYFNSITNKYSWFPPPPPLPGDEVVDDTASKNTEGPSQPKVVDANKSGMDRYFPKVPHPTVTPDEEMDMDSDPEEEIQEEDVEMDEEVEEETEELSEKEKIQRKVFTGRGLLMKGEGGLIEKTKALGIYRKQPRHVLVKDLMAYWIKELGGDADAYILSPCFEQEEQEIMSQRKECASEKRKREFAEAAEEKEGPKKKRKRKALSVKVSLFVVHYYPISYAGVLTILRFGSSFLCRSMGTVVFMRRGLERIRSSVATATTSAAINGRNGTLNVISTTLRSTRNMRRNGMRLLCNRAIWMIFTNEKSRRSRTVFLRKGPERRRVPELMINFVNVLSRLSSKLESPSTS